MSGRLFYGARAALLPQVKNLIPSIVSGLLVRHGGDWADYPRNPEDVYLEVASASCQWRGADGYFIVLRPARRTRDRLASARILTHNPVPKKWAAIRDERTTMDPIQIGFALHRYLYVPDEAADRARATFEGCDVVVVAFADVAAVSPAP